MFYKRFKRELYDLFIYFSFFEFLNLTDTDEGKTASRLFKNSPLFIFCVELKRRELLFCGTHKLSSVIHSNNDSFQLFHDTGIYKSFAPLKKNYTKFSSDQQQQKQQQ